MSKLTLRGKPKAVAVGFWRLIHSPSTRKDFLQPSHEIFITNFPGFGHFQPKCHSSAKVVTTVIDKSPFS